MVRVCGLIVMLVVAALLSVCSGCLSVCRFGSYDSAVAREWSEERQEWVRIETRCVGDSDVLTRYGMYPTMKARWQLLRMSCHWAPKRRWWRQRVGIPLALLALTPGMMIDVVVDTVALPWDWKHRHNVGPDICAPLDDERAYRSLCIICGAKSNGEFARCRSKADRGTVNCLRYYGVCQRCIYQAKAAGYYFR